MKKGILLSLFFLLIFSVLTFAEEISIVKLQGVMMSLDLKKSTVVINEMTFVWDQQTTFHNEAGSPIKIDKLRTKGWVYIEGENDKAHKRWIAKKIYLLPKFIGSKELHLYPFIEQD
jgi:3',5'-cyclic AMP phosphodiesterase CpdA